MRLRRMPVEFEKIITTSANEATARGETFEPFTSLLYSPRLTSLTRRIPIAMENSDEDVFFLSRLHYQRLRYSAQLIGMEFKITHDQFVTEMSQEVNKSDKPWRLKVILRRSGHLDFEKTPAKERDNLFSGLSDTPAVADSADPLYTVVASKTRIDPSMFTRLKTTMRKHYDDARQEAQINSQSLGPDGQPREVLMIDSNGDILEGSVTSVAVYRDGEWLTPPLTAGGSVGVMRSFLLELGYIREAPINIADLHYGDRMLLFNGVIGVCGGHFSSS